ncbi:MAG: hypothetical protein M3Y48_14025 [Actinomycetota bacterium]|nr:hypothetical protein [Actinomycetota bacterium]
MIIIAVLAARAVGALFAVGGVLQRGEYAMAPVRAERAGHQLRRRPTAA